jgi:hypothetical protein
MVQNIQIKGWTHSFKSKAIIHPGPWQRVLPSAKFIVCMLDWSHSTYFFLASELSIEWAHSLHWQIIFSRSWNGQILFCIKILWFYQKVLWNWYHQHARVVDWKHICYLCWTCFSTDIWHIHVYKICSSSGRRVPLFVWGRLHTGASQ